MQNYLDIIMQNKFFLSDSSEDVNKTMLPKSPQKPSKKVTKTSQNMSSQSGGADVDKTTPTAGFPPIFICKKGDKQQEEDKNRGFATKKTAVSIKEIMEERRSNTPFISL